MIFSNFVIAGLKDSDDSPHQSARRRHDSDSDNSPVRDKKPQRKRYDSSDSDNVEKNTLKSASGLRPKRQSPPKQRRRHDSESDQSPPRKRGKASDSDQSPPRKRGQASESDQSPPRKRRQVSDSDQSPPRRRPASDSDLSPPRKRGHASDSDQSPPRSSKMKRSPSGNRTNSRDKKRSDGKREKKSRWSHWEDEEKTETVDNKGRDKKTLSGAVAGLSTAQQMREETKRLRAKEDEEFRQVFKVLDYWLLYYYNVLCCLMAFE